MTNSNNTILASSSPTGVGPQSREGRNSYRYEDEAIDIKWVLSTLYSWRNLIGAAVVLSGLLALVYLQFAARSYLAETHLLIESRQPKIISGDDVAPGLDTGRYIIGQVIESQLQLMRSPRVVERVLRELDLIKANKKQKRKKASKLNKEGGKPTSKLPSTLIANESGGDARTKSVIEQKRITLFLRRLKARRLGQSLIIQISYTHKKPKMAARIANLVASAYLSLQSEARTTKNRNVRFWLKARIVELQGAIRKNRQDIEAYKIKHALVDTDGKLLKERELTEIVSQSIEAKKNASDILARIQQIKLKQNDGTNDRPAGLKLKSTTISDLKKQYAQVNRKLASAISRYGQNHPDVYTNRAELANLQEEIDREGDQLINNLRSEYKIAKSRSKLSKKQVKVLNKELASVRRLAVRLAEMRHEAKVNNDLYAMLLSRLKTAELRSSLQRADTRVVRLAKPPEKPARPRKSLTMAIALMLGTVLSMGSVLLYEVISNTLRTPGNVRRYLGFRRVISLPMLKNAARKTSKDALRRSVAAHSLGNRNSDYIQQIFILNETIKKRKKKGRGQVVALISANDGEGKTTTAVNLMNYMSGAGTKSILIDCDLHSAGATWILSLEPKYSLGELISKERTLQEVIVTDVESDQDYCPVVLDREKKRPMDVLASDEMNELLNDLRQQYDVVILDTPSLNSFVDARVLADEADMIVLVVESNVTTVANVEDALQPIFELKHKINAVVLNKMPVARKKPFRFGPIKFG